MMPKLKLLTKTITVPDHAATGQQMRDARVAAGLTLREVARRMGISPAFLSDLERGRRNWNNRLLDAFELVLQS